MARGGRTRTITPEERELWMHVTRNDQPIARLRTKTPPAAGDEPSIALPPQPLKKEAAPPPSKLKSEKPKAVPHPPLVPAAPAQKPPTQPFDPRLSRQIARGRRAIDARIDLHGLRQDEAHAALTRFLVRAQAQGCRHVLVITGKGSIEADKGDEFWRTESRGVLKRSVPLWLSEPSLRAIVVSFTEAAIQHGGSGALYITLRRKTQ